MTDPNREVMITDLAAPQVARAIERLDRACTFYCEWYQHGRHIDAGQVAYELVSAIRVSLQDLSAAPRDTPPPDLRGSSGQSLRRRDMSENCAFWDFVERSAAEGRELLQRTHPNFRGKEIKQ